MVDRPPPPGPVSLSDREVDLAREVVVRNGEEVSLTTKEAALLAYLVARPGQAVSRDELHAEVWGYNARVVSRAVDTTVRRLRTKIEPVPAHPVHLITVHGTGYRFAPAAATVAEVLPSAFVAADAFVGRASELAQLHSALSRGVRLLTLVGPPGTGKTRLARRLGAEVFDTRPDGVFFCDLTAARTAEDVAAAVGAVLGVPLTSGDAAGEAGALLSDRGAALVVFDNFERVVAHAPATLARFLRDAPAAQLVVTSRERLRLDGEQVLELGPLPVDAAVALYVDRARAQGASSPPRRLVEQIVGRLDRLPLAIELAAARANVLAPEALLRRLDEPLRLLGRGVRGAPQRRASLRGALDASWELLTAGERAALAQCAVFRGGFTVDAAEAVIDLDGIEGAPWVVDALAALRDKSLLQRDANAPGGPRFKLYESVRVYAAEQLEASNQRAASIARHAAATLHLAGELADALDGPGSAEAMHRLAAERENLFAVHRRARGADPEVAVQAVLRVDHLLAARGPMETRLSLLDDAVLLAEAHAPQLLADTLRRRGEARRVRGDQAGARADLERALARAQQDGDARVEAFALGGLAFLEWMCGDIAAAEVRARASLALQRSRGEPVYEGLMWMTLGVLAKRLHRFDEAEEHLRRALAMLRTEGATRFQGLTLSNLANLRREQGALDDAESIYRQAVVVHRSLGHLRWEAGALHNLGALICIRGDAGEAERITREALDVARRGGEALAIGHITHSLGYMLHLQRRYPEAETAYSDSIERLRGLDDQLAASAVGDLAALDADRDRLSAAAHHLEVASRGLEGSQDGALRETFGLHEGHLLAARARAAHRAGNADEGEVLRQAAQGRLRAADAGPPGYTRTHMAAKLLRSVLEADP